MSPLHTKPLRVLWIHLNLTILAVYFLYYNITPSHKTPAGVMDTLKRHNIGGLIFILQYHPFTQNPCGRYGYT